MFIKRASLIKTYIHSGAEYVRIRINFDFNLFIFKMCALFVKSFSGILMILCPNVKREAMRNKSFKPSASGSNANHRTSINHIAYR